MSLFPTRPEQVETACWLALCGALAVGIGIETDWGRNLTRSPADAGAAAVVADPFAPPALAAPYRLPPADSMLETSLRPLFVATRRPAPPPLPPEPPKPAMNKGQFRLTGVSIGPEGSFAFLVDKTSNRTYVVARGKQINGILVKTIGPDRIELSQYDDSEVLILQTAKGPAGPPAAAAATATPATPATPAATAAAAAAAAPPAPAKAPPPALAAPPARPPDPGRITVGGGG